MPDEIKPPKPEETGVYIVWIFAEIRKFNDKLDNFINSAASRVEFEEHKQWGENTAKQFDGRLTKLERKEDIEDASFSRKVSKFVEEKAVVLIVSLLLGTGAINLYYITRYNDVLQKVDEIQIMPGIGE